MWPRRLLILGCGTMGGAMLAGWLAGGAAPERFTVVDRSLAEAPAGVTLLRDLPAAGDYDAVMVGVKPQALDSVVAALAPLVGPQTVLLSILAGAELASLAARFPDAGGIVRIMPNLAVAIGKSPMGLVERGLDGAGRAAVAAFLAPLGTPEWLADEELMHGVTALAGSGPAFVYRFIDALAAAGEGLGLRRGNWRGGWPAPAAPRRRGWMFWMRTGPWRVCWPKRWAPPRRAARKWPRLRDRRPVQAALSLGLLGDFVIIIGAARGFSLKPWAGTPILPTKTGPTAIARGRREGADDGQLERPPARFGLWRKPGECRLWRHKYG